MAEEQLNAYVVALSFGPLGALYVNAMIGPNEMFVAASVTAEFFQRIGTDKPLMGVSVAQLAPEFLRIALRAVEGTLSPDGQNIVSMVHPMPDGAA